MPKAAFCIQVIDESVIHFLERRKRNKKHCETRNLGKIPVQLLVAIGIETCIFTNSFRFSSTSSKRIHEGQSESNSHKAQRKKGKHGQEIRKAYVAGDDSSDSNDWSFSRSFLSLACERKSSRRLVAACSSWRSTSCEARKAGSKRS